MHLHKGLLLVALLWFGCTRSRAEPEPRPPRAFGLVVFEGTCDASGAVPIDSRLFAVADDENNVLRIYDAEKGGPPLYAGDVSAELRVKKKKKGAHGEADLEAATRVDDAAFWLSSHARTKKGKDHPDRFRFFSTDLPGPGKPIKLRGPVYESLLSDLLADPRMRAFGLEAASDKPPQVPGGLNLEGMTAMPDGGVMLGFRNPVPEGRALLVPLLDPSAPLRGEVLRFGAPITLDLGGLGVRSLSYWRGEYLIAAGHYAGGGASRIFTWAGPGTSPASLKSVELGDLNPEGFFTPEQREMFMVLSDDGARRIGGERCKDLDDPEDKRFRGLWVRPRADRHGLHLR